MPALLSRPWPQLLIQMSGLSGSGKTENANWLQKHLGGVIFNMDFLREALHQHKFDVVERAKLIHIFKWTMIENLLQQGFTVIIDTPCNTLEILERGSKVAKRNGVAYWYMECEGPNKAGNQQEKSADKLAKYIGMPVRPDTNVVILNWMVSPESKLEIIRQRVVPPRNSQPNILGSTRLRKKVREFLGRKPDDPSPEDESSDEEEGPTMLEDFYKHCELITPPWHDQGLELAEALQILLGDDSDVSSIKESDFKDAQHQEDREENGQLVDAEALHIVFGDDSDVSSIKESDLKDSQPQEDREQNGQLVDNEALHIVFGDDSDVSSIKDGDLNNAQPQDDPENNGQLVESQSSGKLFKEHFYKGDSFDAATMVSSAQASPILDKATIVAPEKVEEAKVEA